MNMTDGIDTRGGLGFAAGLLSPKIRGHVKALLIVRGVLAVIVGALILIWPGISLEVLMLLIGIFFVLDGIFHVVLGAVDSNFSTGMRVLNVILGLLYVVAGALAIRNPGWGLLFVTIMVGMVWLMEGIFAFATLPPKNEGRGWWIFFAVVSVIAGILVIALPYASIVPLLIVAGAYLVVVGIFDIINGATFGKNVDSSLAPEARQEEKEMASAGL
jgi:uncharacterized membrane protein HdeD (DUF308 family)